jgi:TolB protein
VRLTDNPAYDSWPSWSPDGQFLVFSSNRAGSLGLHLIRSDGTYISLLDTGPGEAFDPSWSPDGRYVAFVSDRDGNAELYRIDAPVLAP